MTATPPKAAPSNARRLTVILAACGFVAAATAGFEGQVLEARPDPVGLPTICSGHIEGVHNGDKATPAQCLALLTADLAAKGEAIDKCIKVPIPVQMRGAFTDFAFNEGSGAFCGSTMLRKLNAGDLAGACRQLNTGDDGRAQWIVAGGRVLPGLVARRAWERKICEASIGEARS